MISKKGYYYFIELAVIVIIVALIFSQLPTSRQAHLNQLETENLRQIGFGVLKSLDDSGFISRYMNTTHFQNSSFAMLQQGIKAPLPKTLIARLEYVYNSTACYNESGSFGGCGVNFTGGQSTTVYYTAANRTEPITIKFYLANVFETAVKEAT